MKLKESLHTILAVLLVVAIVVAAAGWWLYLDAAVARNRKDATALLDFIDFIPYGHLRHASEGNFSRFEDAMHSANVGFRFLGIACDCRLSEDEGLYGDLYEIWLFFMYNETWEVYWGLRFGNYTQEHLDYISDASDIMLEIRNVLVVIEVDGTDPLDQLGSERIQEIGGYADQLRSLRD